MKKTVISIQHTQSEHHTNGMIGAWGDRFEDISRRRYNGSGGSVSKFVIQESGKVIAEYLNRRF